ncbi:MAG: hypothetical protein JXO44_03690 [Clostridia bacterium]|nr:hypothetical protein [Clostridia bacterium]
MLRHLFGCREDEIAQMKKQHQREMMKLALTIVFVVVMLKLFKQLKFFSMLEAVMKLESGNKPVVRVRYRDLLFISKKSEEDEVFIREMDKISWAFVGKYGRGYVFEQDGEELFVHKRQFLGLYDVYSIGNKEYFYTKTSALVQ